MCPGGTLPASVVDPGRDHGFPGFLAVALRVGHGRMEEHQNRSTKRDRGVSTTHKDRKIIIKSTPLDHTLKIEKELL